MKRMITLKTTGLCLILSALAIGCGAQLNPNTEGQIQSALQAKTEAFKVCYEDALKKDRELQGEMGLLLVLDEKNGAVTEAKVEKTEIKDAEMKSCVAGAAQEIDLPEPPGVTVEGHYALDFGFE